VQTAAFCTLLTERIGEPSICISAALCSGLLAIYIRAAPGRECNRHWSCLATPRHIFEQDEAEKPAFARGRTLVLDEVQMLNKALLNTCACVV